MMKMFQAGSVLWFVSVLMTHVKGGNVAATFYPYGPENGDSYGCPNDDEPYGPIDVDNGFPFFGELYQQIYISVNGAITGNPFDDFEPKRFPMEGSIDVSSLCDADQSGDPYCWLNSYYDSSSEWQDNPEREHFPCLNGTLFEENSGIATFDYKFRFGESGPYEDPQCIAFTDTDNTVTDWIIAVYWHDIDIMVGEGMFLFRETTDPAILAMAKEDVERMDQFTGEFNPTWAFVITWMNVTFYTGEQFGYPSDCENQGFSSDCEEGGYIENSMQVVVATDGTTSYGIYNYGAMNWGGGQVGFDAGDNTNYCSVSGSRTDAILKVQDQSNVKVKGRYVMSFSDMNFNSEMCEPHASLPACTCDDGFQGVLCGQGVDDCDFADCAENGACVDGHNSFTCECGLDCQNGGVCELNDAATQYLCQCPSEYYGLNCQYFNECLSEPCKNGGECVDQTDAYQCICPDGWTGNTCSDVDFCVLANQNCSGHGTCINGESNYSCQCNTGWAGVNCTECASGHSGDNCEEDKVISNADHQVDDSPPGLLVTLGGSLLGFLGLLALVGIIVFLLLRRRKKKIRDAQEKKDVVPMQNNWTSTKSTTHGVKAKPPMIHSDTLTSLDVVPNSQPPAMFVLES